VGQGDPGGQYQSAVRSIRSTARFHNARSSVDDTLLRCIMFSGRMSESGHNRPPCSALLCLLPPGADMVREKSPLAKPRHSALAGAFVVANLAAHALRPTPEPATQTRRLVPPPVQQVRKVWTSPADTALRTPEDIRSAISIPGTTRPRFIRLTCSRGLRRDTWRRSLLDLRASSPS
jgi:hypothetical protein